MTIDARRCLLSRPPHAASTRTWGIATLTSVLVLSGCSLLPSPSEDVLLDEGTTAVELEVGETAQVSLGTGSQGVGDDWGVISQSEDGVVSADVVLDDDVFGAGDGSNQPGSSMPYAVQLTGESPGTSTVRVLYCTRTAIAEDCDQSQGTLEPPVDPVEITVTVR